MISFNDFNIPQGVIATKEIQNIFNIASERGETVYIPKGLYLTGTVNIGRASVYLEKGAILKGSANEEDYPPIGFVHNEMHQTKCLLWSWGAQNFKIYGEGTIDFSASEIYDMTKPIDRRYESDEFTEKQKNEAPRYYRWRPTQPMFFYGCKNITIEGITLTGATCWTVSFHKCQNILCENIKIDNALNIPNSDGLHFCGSKDVVIRNCNFSCGDDCIALSSITDWDEPCENFEICNCRCRSVSKAISIGYMHSIVRNVHIHDCEIYDTQRGIVVMSSKGTGIVENIRFENIKINTHIRVGNWWGNGEPIAVICGFHNYEGYMNPIPQRGAVINARNIAFKNIQCEGENIIGIYGDDNVENITFENVTFKKLPSENAYVKGERVIDIDPCQDRCEYPEDFEGFIYSQGVTA